MGEDTKAVCTDEELRGLSGDLFAEAVMQAGFFAKVYVFIDIYWIGEKES